MEKCNYYDCGWCYAPNDVATNAHSSSACLVPQNCPYLKTQMTEIEKVKSEIKVLEAKLSLLEEMENHKSPAEEAYKRVYSGYPDTFTDVQGIPSSQCWFDFSCGYNAAQEDYKVGEYQEPVEESAQERVEKLLEVKKLREKEWKVDVKTDLKPWEPTAQTPEETERGLRDAMKQAKKDGVFDDIINEWAEKNKPPTLYQILMNWWINVNLEGWSDEEVINSLIDVIDKEFIPPHSDTNDYQWNKCLKLMRNKLR